MVKGGGPCSPPFSLLAVHRQTTACQYAGNLPLCLIWPTQNAADDVNRCLEAGVDFVSLGRASILHHDFPRQVLNDPDFKSVKNPVTRDYLRAQGLSEAFLDYMASWNGFVED